MPHTNKISSILYVHNLIYIDFGIIYIYIILLKKNHQVLKQIINSGMNM
jgi:hypothetical protein